MVYLDGIVFAYYGTKSFQSFLFGNGSDFYELNYHDQKIQQTLAHDIQYYWTAVLTLLGLISSVYCDLPHWRLNQQPLNAEPKLYH